MSTRNCTLRNQFLTAALIVCTLASFLASLATPVHAEVSLTESFTGTTAPGWEPLLGSATLTAATGVDAAGSGWLRLTDAVNDRAGSAIYNTPFSSTDGVQVTFQYATYGGTGADGFSFYLINGATGTPTVGAPGGSLGYSSSGGTIPGVTNGYVGIGFDEWGDFTATTAGDCLPNPPGCPGRIPNIVAIRGSGSDLTGFNYLTHRALSRAISTGSRAAANTVRITILEGRISVEMDFGSGFVSVIDKYNLATAFNQATIPVTLKMGFSASTGGSTNIHEIRGLTVGGAQPTATALVATPNPVQEGQPVTLTATVTNSLGDTRVPSGTVTFLDNGVSIGTGTLNASGVATFTTSALAFGTRSITARYEGDAIFGASTSSVASQVVIPVVTLTTTSTPGYAANGSVAVIQPNLTVTGNGTLNGALVLISANFVPVSDTLGIQGKTGTSGTVDGLTWIYTPTTGVLALNGSATPAVYQGALRQVTFSTSNSSTLARTVQFSLGSSLPNAANDHYYEFVGGRITWTAAQAAAAARNFFGLQGYLATVTSAAENSFIAGKLEGEGWMGASDAATEGEWFWVTGPEAGTQFSTGDNPPTAFSNRYMNWDASEPNNLNTENYGHFLVGGNWNDYANDDANIQGYVVEYGGMTGDPTIHVRADATVLVDPAGDPDNDGVPTGIEQRYGTNPLDTTSPVANPTADDDGDGVTNAWEAILQTDPADPDSNSARTTPKDENNNGIGDADEDLDGDGVPNGIEIRYGTDPLLATSPVANPTADDDGDGVTNAWEAILQTDPNDPDSDSARTPATNENNNSVNDGAEDFDGDGVGNAQEITNGTNPLDPNDPLKTDLEVTQAFQMANLSKLTLTITVTNKGPNAVASAVLSDTFPTALTGGVWSWSCSGTACSAASGTGNLNAILGTLPVSGTVVFTATGTLANWTHWTNTARIILPAKILDSVIANNTSQIGRYRLLLPIVYKR